MGGNRITKARLLLLMGVATQLSFSQARPSSHSEEPPSLRRFFQDLVEHYSPSTLPKYDELSRVTSRISTQSPEYTRDALPEIFTALTHPDENVKGDAALALLVISQRPDSAELLSGYIGAIGSLFDLPDPRLQEMALQILPNLKPIPPPEVFPLLLAFVRRSDRDPRAQADALRYLLGQTAKRSETVAAAIEFWSRPMDNSTRISTINALSNSGSADPRVISLVTSSLDDHDFDVRWVAFQGVCRMGPVALRQANLPMQKVVNEYLNLLKREDADPNRQLSAIKVLLLCEPKNPEVVNAVVEFYSRPLDTELRKSVEDALHIRHIQNVRLIDLMVGSLQDPNPEVRSHAAYALADMGPNAVARAQPSLEKLSQDPSQPVEVKQGVTRALKETGHDGSK